MKSKEFELGAALFGLALAAYGAYAVHAERFHLGRDAVSGAQAVLTGSPAVRFGLYALLAGLGITACALYLFFRYRQR